ncbi:NAD(P)H-quinone oxidoreductase [Streptomyces sp. NPDC055056]
MQAVLVPSPGTVDAMKWTLTNTPEPGTDEVQIEVRATGVNNADILQRQGLYPVPTDDSPLLGLECAGVVSAVGAGVTQWHVGDQVCALLNGGGYAEWVVVPAAQVLPMPDSLTYVEAAALPEAACTVFSNIGMLAQLSPGETFLVHGGTSGIGTLAIQWAKALGARVLTTAGTPQKVARAIQIGADTAINYRSEDFPCKVMDVTDGRGADVILDLVGAPYLDRNIHCLALDGRLVMIGCDVTAATLDIGALMRKRGSVSATTLRARSKDQKARIVEAVRKEMWPMVADGRIRPVVETSVPMERVAEAHTILEEGKAVGKVVLTL